MNARRFQIVTAACLAAVLLTRIAVAEDWPAHKKDSARSSVTSDVLQFPLAQRWVYCPRQSPRPAWPEPGKELNRTDFDRAFQPIVAGGLVYFGSSADDTVRAVDADTGEPVWRFVTRGPVRFAPAIARGKLYVGSDDGILYCLNAATGEPIWRFRAEPDRDHVIGNGRLIARYPCRSGVLAVEDIVYVTAGMWPTEGVYVYALDADSGRELWCNDSSGNIYTDLPHAFANGFSGVAPQGYLLATEDVLIVPTGRSVPAAFDRHTGRLLHYKPEKTHYHGAQYGGGVWCTAHQDIYFNTSNRSQNPSEAYVGEAEPSIQDSTIAYSDTTGEQLCQLRGKYRVLVAGKTIYAAGNGSIEAVNLTVLRRKTRLSPTDANWTTPHPARVYCLAMADNTLLTGNRDSIAAYAATDGKPVWQVDLKGRQVRGMAVANGRLVAATDSGEILCFGSLGSRQPANAAPKQLEENPASSTLSDREQNRAKEIVERTGKSAGYALVVGEPDSRLAEALARHSRLHVVSLAADATAATAQRERLLDAGLLGSRVAVCAVAAPGRLQLPSYFADLVVISKTMRGFSPKDSYQALRPCGGTLCFLDTDDTARREFIAGANIPPSEVEKSVVVRGKLPGAGEWRYPWANGGRSGIGAESRVRFPVQLLWFGGPGPGRLLDRHLMPSPPLSVAGRVFLQGQNHVLAFDAYNGRELWSQHIQEAGRKYAQYYCSSMVADDDGVYLVQYDKCLRLDQASGQTTRTYTIPESVVRGTPRPTVPDYLDLQWPNTWCVLGPFPKGRPPLSEDVLKTLPPDVTVKGKKYVSIELGAANNIIDFTQAFGGYGFQPLRPGQKPAAGPQRGKRFGYHDVGRICYAMAKIECPAAGKLLIGAGADWGMQWFLDGKPVLTDLRNGSTAARRGFFSREICSPKDRLFDVDVTAGEHVLAVMVTAGSRGWALASDSMAGREKELMTIATDENPNVPNLRDLDWGYLSVTDDLLLGSYNVPVTEGQPAESHLIQRSESKALFALNKTDGSLRWVYRPRPDRILANIEIAFGDGKIFLIDGTSKADLVRAIRRNRKIEPQLTLVALDLARGTEVWRQDDIPVLGDRSTLSRLKTNISHLFMGQPSWGHLVHAEGVVMYGANAAYDAATGKKLWLNRRPPGKLPLVHGNRIITAENAYDLRTGQQCMTEDILTGQSVPWRYTRAYGCGPIAGCKNVLFFRSGAAGFYDMETEGTTNFGGVRSGCARTLLAANGLLIHPQGYSGCGCCYNYKTNLALVPVPARDDTWYVLPRRAESGLIKRVAVNFGAPGDRRDQRKAAWLGFPRPMLQSACPASVTISMRRAECNYRRGVTGEIQKTDSPWLYSSGLFGQGRVAVDLVLNPNIGLPRLDASPVVDGNLDDACWKDIKTVPLQNTPFSMLAASLDFRIFRDARNIYFAYRAPSVTAPSPNATKKLPGAKDGLEIFLADSGKSAGIHLVVGRKSQPTATFGTVATSRKTDPEWKGQWQALVRETSRGWTAEVALPIETLTESGMNPGRLRLNCMAQARTESGFQTVFLTDPLYGTKFRSCVGFRRVVPAALAPPAQRCFTVRLHFAELDNASSGRRVFDVALQGQTVIKDLDVFEQAGGKNTALVKEFRNVKATDQIWIDVGSTDSKTTGKQAPMLNAVEIIEEDQL